MTAGYGVCDFDGADDENRFYTDQFSGTSSASALVAGAAAALQSWAMKNTFFTRSSDDSSNSTHLRRSGGVLSPSEMRDVLSISGVAQDTQDAQRHGAIGPHINLRNAIEYLMDATRQY